MTSNEEKSPAIHISLLGTSDDDFLLALPNVYKRQKQENATLRREFIQD